MKRLFSLARIRRRDEEGATTIVVVFLSIALFAAAALAVDYSSLTMEKQRLHDHVDAAAHAGAFDLPGSGSAAEGQARAMAERLDPEMTPDIDFWCIVASEEGAPADRQIPATCDPGPRPFTGVRCDDRICAIPCFPDEGHECNSMRVSDEKTVPFGFGRVIGVNEGDTGAVTTVACRGTCGEESPNPMDVVVMADRTPSMEDDDREQMKLAIQSMLETMSPDMHYVAFGALHKSSPTWGCRTEESTSGATSGVWVPVEFSNDYHSGGETPVLNSGSRLVQGIRCLPASDDGNYGTHLASALKGAARYLLGEDGNNLSSLPRRPGAPTRVIIFETDGMPDETYETAYRGLRDNRDMAAGNNGSCRSGYPRRGGYCTDYRSNSNGLEGCQNFLDVAEEAKEAGITVITIGFGTAATAGCTVTNRSNNGLPVRSGGTPVRDFLAAAASPDREGVPSDASTCHDDDSRRLENTDEDNYFCAAGGAEMADIFRTAIAQIDEGVHFVRMPPPPEEG